MIKIISFPEMPLLNFTSETKNLKIALISIIAIYLSPFINSPSTAAINAGLIYYGTNMVLSDSNLENKNLSSLISSLLAAGGAYAGWEYWPYLYMSASTAAATLGGLTPLLVNTLKPS